MASYLRSWLPGGSTTNTSESDPEPTTPKATPVILAVQPPTIGLDDYDNDIDAPPAFPALNSAQRSSPGSSSALPAFLTDTQRMPPPPMPSKAVRTPGPPQPTSSLSVPSSSLLMLPPSTTKPLARAARKREKIALAPGFGPLDWAALKSSGQDLRGVDTLLRITPAMLKEHNTREDAWTAINGKVYNITHYLPFHPGGEKELMRVAGRDGSKLFGLTHAWVNADYMLDQSLVGFMVPGN